MTKLVVRLLGGFRVELDGEVVYDFETDKARALLAYLVVEADRPHRRETLSGLLWPDQPDAVARARLRQTIYRVRQALTGPWPGDFQTHDKGRPSFLFVTSTDVQFNTASNYSLDVAELEAFARQAGTRRLVPRELLPAALCADFLAGFSAPDSEAFEAWVLGRQEQCHRLAMDILEAQGEFFEAGGDYEQAVAAARLELQIEPWLEEAHRRLMRGLALAGRGGEALHQYEACRRALRVELGAEPNAVTQALYAAIRDGRLASPALRSNCVVKSGFCLW